jgi:hypothetical protein
MVGAAAPLGKAATPDRAELDGMASGTPRD